MDVHTRGRSGYFLRPAARYVNYVHTLNLHKNLGGYRAHGVSKSWNF